MDWIEESEEQQQHDDSYVDICQDPISVSSLETRYEVKEKIIQKKLRFDIF